MAAKVSTGMLLQMVRQNDEKHEEGHTRLRTDWREHDDELEKQKQRMDRLEGAQTALDAKITSVATAPHDFSKLSVSPGIVVSIVMAVVGIVGGQVASTWGMRSDIRDISTRIESQSNRNQDAQRLQDERFSAMREKIDGIEKKQELQRLEMQSLKETILNQRRP